MGKISTSIELLPFLMITFQWDALKSLRMTVLSCKTGKRLLKIFTSPQGREIIFSHKYLKVFHGKGDQLLQGRKNPVQSLVKLREVLRPSWAVFNFIIKFENVDNLFIKLFFGILIKMYRKWDFILNKLDNLSVIVISALPLPFRIKSRINI